MGDSCAFAVDVFRTVCERFRTKSADLQLLVETGCSFDGWLTGEAFLACQLRAASYPFCEVAAEPTYTSEGVADEGGPDRTVGDLRVGGPNDGADHCWVFAEFALLRDGTGEGWLKKIETGANKLKRLGWKRSAALLIVVAASRGDLLNPWSVSLSDCAVWNQPALTDPFVITLPGGGSVVLKAFDIKRDPTHTLTATAH